MSREEMKPGEIRDWGRVGATSFLFFFTVEKEAVFDTPGEAFRQACHYFAQYHGERAPNDYRGAAAVVVNADQEGQFAAIERDLTGIDGPLVEDEIFHVWGVDL